jgi:hypothetical protein
MSVDIITIPEEKLRADLEESYFDITVCEAALRLGVTTYNNGRSVQDRLQVNVWLVKKISAELARRGKSSVVVM